MSFGRQLSMALGAAVFLGAATASAAPIKVACVGEQTTHSDQLNRSVEYPAMLNVLLGPNYDAANYGGNFGDCCATVLTGYPKQAETHPYIQGGGKPSYNESIAYLPDIVVIGSWGKHDTEIANSLYMGTLDPQHFTADYETLVTAYLNLSSKPRVFVSTPVPIPKGAPMGVTTNVILPTVKDMAAKYNLPIVDLYSVFLNHPELYKDDTHVSNDTGLHTIAQTVYDAIKADSGIPDAGAPDAMPPDTSSSTASSSASSASGEMSGGAGGSSSSTMSGSGGSLGVATSSSTGTPAAQTSGGASHDDGTSGQESGCAAAPGSKGSGAIALLIVACCALLVRARASIRNRDDRARDQR
jgi:hypothetical protein